MPLSRVVRLGCALALLLSAAGGARVSSAQPDQPGASDEAVARLSTAVGIQGATRARLGVLGDAFSCPDARFVSFRRSDAEPEFVDQWYVASQLWADALLLVGPDEQPDTPPDIAGWDPIDTRCHLDKGFVFLDRLWDYTSAGYFPRANPVGTSVENKVRFSADNMLAGLALLDAARTTTD